jgi:hypothetical protein
MNRIEQIGLGIALAALASPAFAGAIVQTPAPIAGVGLGAVALIGLGYRTLKSRIGR